MAEFAYVPGGTGTVESIIIADQSWVDQQPNTSWYVDVTAVSPRPNPGWTYDGVNFTEPAYVPTTRYILTGPEWVEAFTDVEWQWLKTRRNDGTAAGDRLDQMMDAIRWTNSVDVSATEMDEFYTWLLNQGLPGGQTRIDELRSGITE